MSYVECRIERQLIVDGNIIEDVKILYLSTIAAEYLLIEGIKIDYHLLNETTNIFTSIL